MIIGGIISTVVTTTFGRLDFLGRQPSDCRSVGRSVALGEAFPPFLPRRLPTVRPSDGQTDGRRRRRRRRGAAYLER